MTPSHPDWVEEFKSHFNEPVLHIFDLVRLVGYGETQVDIYVICRRPNPHNDLVWISCVGGVTYLDRLKGQSLTPNTEWDDFYRLDNALHLNGAPKEEIFIIDLRPDDWEYLSQENIERFKARAKLQPDSSQP